MMAEALAFWSVILPAKGKDVQQEVESTETALTSIHITGASLGKAPQSGPHVIELEYNGVNTVLATLEVPHTRQCRFDVVVDQTCKMRVHGDSEVHLYGYQITTAAQSEEGDDEDDEDYALEDDESDEGEEQSDDESEDIEESDDDVRRPPKAIPIMGLNKKAVATPGSDRMDTDDGDADEEDEDEDEEGSSEDEDEEGSSEDEDEDLEQDDIPEFGDLGSDDLIGEADEAENEDEEEDKDEEEEQPPAKLGGKRVPQTPQPGKPAKQQRQEPPKSAPPKQQQQLEGKQVKQKKQQPQQPQQPQAGSKEIPVTASGADAKPQPVKVVSDKKGGKAAAAEAHGAKDAGKGVPAGKEAGKGGKAAPEQSKGGKDAKKAPAAPPAPATETEYRAALVNLIKSQKGPVAISQLGSAVKKPASVPKLTVYLKDNAELFEVAGDKVSLKQKK